MIFFQLDNNRFKFELDYFSSYHSYYYYYDFCSYKSHIDNHYSGHDCHCFIYFISNMVLIILTLEVFQHKINGTKL